MVVANKRVLMGQIHPSELAIGVPLPYTVYDENYNLLLHKGVTLTNERQLEALLARGLYRVDDLAVAGDSPPLPENPLDRLDRLCGELNTLLAAPQQGAGGFQSRLLAIAARLDALCEDDPDACLAGMLHDRQMRYAVRHMVHCAVVSCLLAVQRNLSPSDRLSLVAAALTMNLSILGLQNELNGPAKRSVTEFERRQIRMHPERTVAQLTALGVSDGAWLEIVGQHHESFDGSGYPAGLRGEKIALGARIIALVDGYIARLRHRADRHGKLPNESLREMFVSRGAEVDPALAQQLVRTVGIFPPGLVVELENGEVGVVVRRTDNAHAPDVQVMVAHERLLTQPEPRVTVNSPWRIKSALAADAMRYRFDPLRFWQET